MSKKTGPQYVKVLNKNKKEKKKKSGKTSAKKR